MNLKILLIMPYFERPNMVLNALRSMESVNYDNYEFCIIDDGSVLNPIEDVIKKYNFNIKNLKILKTNDSIENKLKRGSIHGSFMNRAMRESDADIIVMMSDDDALHKNYFNNLNSNIDEKFLYLTN
jgi:glycosyltransferase involved in cell wall biosynthesis